MRERNLTLTHSPCRRRTAAAAPAGRTMLPGTSFNCAAGLRQLADICEKRVALPD